MSEEALWRHASEIAQVDDGVRVYLVDLAAEGERSVPVVLEGTAADIWRAVASGTTIDAASRDLAAVYETSPEAIRDDVEDFLDSLAAQRLVERPADSDAVD